MKPYHHEWMLATYYMTAGQSFIQTNISMYFSSFLKLKTNREKQDICPNTVCEHQMGQTVYQQF